MMRKIGKAAGLFVLLYVLYFVLGAILPFVRQPKVTEDTRQAFDASQFYGDETVKERACVISDNGEALQERIRLISQAREQIILSTFEFDSDESGKDMLAALISAAERGVEVLVLADGAFSILEMNGNPYFYALSSLPNAEIRIYNQVNFFKPWTAMGRMHDKYLIADDTAYILGGRNTYDYFLGDQPGYKNYDWDILVYSGGTREESLGELCDYFQGVWELEACETFPDGSLLCGADRAEEARQELRERYEGMKADHPDWFTDCDYKSMTEPVKRIQLLSNPTSIWAKEPVVFYNMTQLMKTAEEEVVFHTPYIICNDWMLQQLQQVCDQVENVRMMTNSVANNGNPFGAMDYERNKGKILDTGVQILEYDGGVSYHGKCFTMDDRLSAVGSFNWDMRSAYLDTELMLVVDSKGLNRELRREMKEYEKDALTVVDQDTSIAPEGKTPQKLTLKRNVRMKLVRIFAGWARFLM